MNVVIASDYGYTLAGTLKSDRKVTFVGKPCGEEALRAALDRLGIHH